MEDDSTHAVLSKFFVAAIGGVFWWLGVGFLFFGFNRFMVYTHSHPLVMAF